MQHIQRTWPSPIWRHRAGRLQQLLQWCLACFRAESVKRADGVVQLEEALHQALRFAEDFHQALNPEGARLAIEDQAPSCDLEGGKPYLRWSRTVGTVWTHDPSVHHVARWKETFAAKRTGSWPVGCNR